jgi:intraflagellar transport protein 20
MAEEALSHAGLYLDELNKIRLLEPESAQQTIELKDECKDFVDSKFLIIILILRCVVRIRN